ncbi:MAG: NAD(P)-dependent oxidoreductase, partial [Actinomycetota bacterium]|nr:NAD(P)-dependent oxidoreductase [Actinomycetota bacterium]
MRIIVTGGSGKLGRNVVRGLRDAGHDVLNFDVTGERGPNFLRVDLTDFGQVVDALFSVDFLHDGGFEAIVHLAAVPAGGIVSDVSTFQNNILSTFHVFQAARRAGIKRIVHASSETV